MRAVLDTLTPLVVVIALGAMLRWIKVLSEEALRGMSWLVFWVALPAMLFTEVAGLGQTPAAGHAPGVFNVQQLHIFLIGLAGMAACIIAGYAIALAIKMPKDKVGTFIQAVYRGNLAYIGLPVVQYAFTTISGEAAGRAALRDAAVALAPLIMLYNVTAVIVLLAGQQKPGWHALKRMAIQIITNPLILACGAGLIWSSTNWQMPSALTNALQLLSNIASPLALLTVGAAIATTRFTGLALYTSIGVGIKEILTPLAGLAWRWCWGRAIARCSSAC